MNLKVGDRVILISNKYAYRANNPKFNGRNKTVFGTVFRIRIKYNGDLEQLPINVRWDNGTSNVYDETDLECLSHPKIGDKIMDIRTKDIGIVTKMEGERVWAKWEKDKMEFYIHVDDTEKILNGGVV